MGLLTRLPVAHLPAAAAPGIWAYPVVGLGVGALGAAAYWAGHALRLPPLVAALWSLAAMTLATGGLHEDGLADTADGFGGGATRARKLEIMRDSRIGSFGALALVLSIAIRAASLAALADTARVAPALIAAGALGRAAMLVPVVLLPPARADGLAAGLGKVPHPQAALGGTLAVAASFALLPAMPAAVAVLAALAVGLGMAALAWRQVEGHTGDVLGATEMLAECAILSVLA